MDHIKKNSGKLWITACNQVINVNSTSNKHTDNMYPLCDDGTPPRGILPKLPNYNLIISKHKTNPSQIWFNYLSNTFRSVKAQIQKRK